MKPIYKKLINIIIMLLFIIIGSQIGLKYAFVLYIVMFLGFFLYKLYKERDLFILNMKVAEAKLFGKPLDKEFWKKGELKNKKIKVVWKKPKAKRLKK